MSDRRSGPEVCRPTRILLTGGSGQVGRALRPHLEVLVAPAGGTVLVPGRDELDLARLDDIEPFVEHARPDLIVSAAAYTAVDRAEGEPDLARAVNAEAPGHLAVAAARTGAAMVHLSTDYVFGGASARPCRPDDPTDPRSVYGRTKLAGEVAARSSGASCLVLRLCWIYDGVGRNFLRTMLKLAGERDELRVVDDQRGTPTFAGDLATWITAMIDVALIRDGDGSTDDARWHFGERAGTWHLAAEGDATWFDFARAIIDAAGFERPPRIVPVTTAEYPTVAVRPAWSVLDCAATDAAFGLRRHAWTVPVPAVVRAALARGGQK